MLIISLYLKLEALRKELVSDNNDSIPILKLCCSVIILICTCLSLSLILPNEIGYAADKICAKPCNTPTVIDPNLKLDIIYQGNFTPGLRELNQFTSVTQFAFLGNDDILLLNKNDGKVQRIINGKAQADPLLDVNVTNQWESGLLGIAISNNTNKKYVFLYYTESPNGDVSNSSGTESSYNKLYRYDLINNKLTNAKLLFSSPSANRYSHIGGNLQIGPDTICTLQLVKCMETRTKLQGQWPRIIMKVYFQTAEPAYLDLPKTDRQLEPQY